MAILFFTTEYLLGMSHQGNLKGVPSISEPLQITLENGAIRAMAPISNEAQFAAFPDETVENLDVIFYGDLERAVLQAIDL